jgi:hypothetical protein
MALKTFFKVVIPRDPKYLKMVDGQPCLICGRKSTHHHQPKKGECNRPKCSDYRTLPLCIPHHIDGNVPGFPGSYHGMGKITGWSFWDHYGIDPEDEIERLNQKWIGLGQKLLCG